MSLLAMAYVNPFRRVDWRWQRAVSIVNGEGRRASRAKDSEEGFAWIIKAARFLREYNACATELEILQLSERRPDMFWAYQVFTQESTAMKSSIEAHLLARGTDYEIAYRCGMSPETVKTYEALFFNVREKLNHRQYILHCVMGSSIQRSLGERDFDLLWKLYGYFLGPFVLDAMESKFAQPVWCGTAEAVPAAVMDDAIGTLKLKAAIAAKTAPVNQHTQMALMDAFTKFVEVERNSDSAGKSQEQILDHIQAMMTTLPFNIGGRDPKTKRPMINRGPIEAFERSAIELTYEETMRISVRQPIANAETLKMLEFPTTQSTQLLE